MQAAMGQPSSFLCIGLSKIQQEQQQQLQQQVVQPTLPVTSPYRIGADAAAHVTPRRRRRRRPWRVAPVLQLSRPILPPWCSHFPMSSEVSANIPPPSGPLTGKNGRRGGSGRDSGRDSADAESVDYFVACPGQSLWVPPGIDCFCIGPKLSHRHSAT